MSDFASTLRDAVTNAVLAIAAADANDIYALSFFIYDEEDDPRRPILTVGYNTEARWRECCPKPGQRPAWPIASDSSEARWNYSFWLQNSLITVGTAGTASAAARESWIKEQSLWWSDQQIEVDFDSFIAEAEQITEAFIGLCVQVSRTLHEHGILTTALSKTVPIIVHELEYYEQIATQTQEANPIGLAREFEDWVMGSQQ